MNLSGIILDFKAGEPDAFDVIYDMFSRQILAYCYRYTLSRETAEELTNDVFMHLWNKREYIDSEMGIKGLLYKIAKNEVCRWFRKVSGNKQALAALEEHYRHELALHDQQIEASLDLNSLKEAMQCLPPQRKRIFELCKFRDMTYTEVAAVLSISKDSVRKHMIEANKTLVKITQTGEYQYYYYLIFAFLLT